MHFHSVPEVHSLEFGQRYPRRESGQTGLGGESNFTHWSRHSSHKEVWNFIYLCIYLIRSTEEAHLSTSIRPEPLQLCSNAIHYFSA